MKQSLENVQENNSSLFNDQTDGTQTSTDVISIRRAIHQVISRQYNLSLQSDALYYLESLISSYNIPRSEFAATLELIAQTYRKNDGRESLVSKRDLETIVARLSQVSVQNSGETEIIQELSGAQLSKLIHIIDGYNMPRWTYDPEKKGLYKCANKASVFGQAKSKIAVHRDRYELIRQRVLRNQMFRQASSKAKDDGLVTITPISSLRGYQDQSFVIFGMLARLEDTKLYLEDTSGHVELDISAAVKSRGFFTETCFAVVDGVYTEDKVFKATAIAMPPAEPKQESIQVFGQLDFLGVPPEIYDLKQLIDIEKRYEGINMVFLSDVHLDIPMVVEALRKLFTGCEDTLTPLVIVMCGNFCSSPQPASVYRELWANFADMVAAFPTIKTHSKFVLVPGPHDPWGKRVFPRPPLAEHLVTKKLQQTIANLELATNPCRIKYCSQEIVIYRDDLLTKMYRNSILAPENTVSAKELPYHLARTLIDQSHLCPVPLHVNPVVWEHENCMWIYPNPDLVILADKAEKYQESYEGTLIVNPGSFDNDENGFVVYFPYNKSIQDSTIN